MKVFKTQNIALYIILGLLVLIAVLVFSFFERIKKMYEYFSKVQEVNTVLKIQPQSNNQGLTSKQSPVTIVQTAGRYFLGKRIINLTNESIGNVYRLTDVPKGSSYCTIHLIECEVEYNQDGDFANGSPVSDSQITIDSGALISVFHMKVTSAIMPEAKIYIEYYQ